MTKRMEDPRLATRTAADYQTTYTEATGATHVAYQIPWSAVHAIVGHAPHDPPEDDATLVRWLRDHGAPEWVEQAAGWIDELGWGLIGPALFEAESAKP